MAVNFSAQVYSPNFDVWSRSVTFFPVASQPLVSQYSGRGIFDTRAIDIIGLDNSVVSDQKTILDLLDAEYPILPAQQDRVFIPADGAIPEAGWFEIQDVDSNGGGETTLTLRRWEAPAP